MKRILALFAAIMLLVFQANAQTGTWSGKLDVQGTKLSLVFHLDGDNPTMDSPDQGAKGIPVLIERKSYGGLRSADAELLGCSSTDSDAIYDTFPQIGYASFAW